MSTRTQDTLQDIGDLLHKARGRSQKLWEDLESGGEDDLRIAPLVNALIEAILNATAVKAIALGVAEEWEG
jgi:hypothetical protein